MKNLSKLESIVKEYLSLQFELKNLKEKVDNLKELIQNKVPDEKKIGNYFITNKTIISNRLDVDTLKENLPDIYSRFLKETESHRLTIKAIG